MNRHADSRPVVLGVSPHPDDEILGAGATLMALRDAGWRVVALPCGLGSRHADHDRRRRELTEACTRAGFEPASGGVEETVARCRPAVIVAPSPHDVHPAHEAAGRAVRDTVERLGMPARVWFWGLWGELPLPNMIVGFDSARLAELRHALAAHAGELARNRFDRVLEARGAACAVLGPERVFGFGVGGSEALWAELLSDVGFDGGGWRLAAPRWLDPIDAVPAIDPERPEIGWWLHATSVRSRLGQ